jgi:hypothetical protein
MNMIDRRRCLLALAATALAACGRRPDAAVEAALEAFYARRGSHRDVDRSRLSRELAELLTRAIAAEDEDRARVKASEFPDEKPMLIEGDIFTGLYEGANRLDLRQVAIDGARARATVAFENTDYDIAWTDEVLLVDEDGWKIDDVVYGREGAAQPGLRATLTAFIAAATPP